MLFALGAALVGGDPAFHLLGHTASVAIQQNVTIQFLGEQLGENKLSFHQKLFQLNEDRKRAVARRTEDVSVLTSGSVLGRKKYSSNRHIKAAVK